MNSVTKIFQFKKYLTLSAFLFVVLHILTIFKGFDGDMFFWYDWGKMIYKNGLGSVYRTSTDYLPLSHYFLAVYVFFQSTEHGVRDNIEFFKIVPLIVHFIGGYFVVKLIEKDRLEKYAIQKSLFYLLNVSILYNALVWGQVDIIFSCLAFISFYCAIKENITVSLLLLVAAINCKLQAIVFLPPIFLMLLPFMIRDFSAKNFLKWLIFPLLFQVLILLPYWLDGSIGRVWSVVTESFGKYPVISLKAYNIWHLIFPDLKLNESDNAIFAGLRYKTWGFILFCVTSFFALLPLLKTVYESFKTRVYKPVSLNKALLISGIVPLLFFYFNTEMHERYSHPCLIFILVYGIRTSRPILPFMATWCYFFNLEGALQEFQIDNYGTVIFHPVFISSLWLLTLIGLFLNLYEVGPSFVLRREHFNQLLKLGRNLYSLIEPAIVSFNGMKLWKRYLVIAFVAGIILHLLTPTSGHGWDTYCWQEWAKAMHKFGLKNIYSTWNEYLPLFQYFLKVYTLFQLSEDAVVANIHYFKLGSLLFHLISGYLVVVLIRKNNEIKNPIAKSMLYLLNIAVLCNGLVWGQVDIILAGFMMITFYFTIQENITLAVTFLLAAINFKIHAVVFVPPVGLMLLPLMVRDFSFGRLAKWLLVPLAFQVVILIPFYIADDLHAAWAVVTDSFTRYSSVSLNAFNFWHLVFPHLTVKDPDTGIFMGLTYKNWGLILFFLASCLALFPLFKVIFESIRQRKYIALSLDKSLLIFALIPFLFFFFNTDMHERYSHPGLIFAITYGLRKGRLLIPVIASFAYLFNLEAVLMPIQWPEYHSVFFEPLFIAILWAITIIGLYLNLYDLSPSLSITKRNDERPIHSSPNI